MRPLALLAAGVLLLAGCSSTVTGLKAAESADDPACASVVDALPDTVDGLQRRSTDASGTGAWGQPATVLLRCGVPSPAPTAELPCLTFGGVDWIVDSSDDAAVVAVSYGRSPAVEVVVDAESPGIALGDLGAAVALIPADRACIGIGDAP